METLDESRKFLTNQSSEGYDDWRNLVPCFHWSTKSFSISSMSLDDNLVVMKENVPSYETASQQLEKLTLDNRQKVSLFILAYYHQLTKGCLLPHCTNKFCASNMSKNNHKFTFLEKMTDEEAKAQAVSLTKQSLLSKENFFCDCKSVLFPVVTHSGHHALQPEYLLNHIESCKNSKDFTPLIRDLESLFSSSDSLNQSFLIKKAFLRDDETDAQCVDLDAVKALYEEFDALKNDSVNKKLKESIATLMNTLSKDKIKRITKPIHLRQLEIILEHPGLMDPNYHGILLDITKIVLELPNELKIVLKKWFATYSPERFRRLISLYQQFITIQLFQMGVIDEKISYATRVLGLLSNTNDTRKRGQQVNFQDFYNDAVNSAVDLESDYRRWMRSKYEKINGFTSFSFCNYPYILDATSKQKVLEIDAQFQQAVKMRESLTQSLFMSGNISMSNLFFVLKVERDNLIETTLNGIVGQSPEVYKKQLRVHFVGEEGVDEGGVKKEFFQLLIKQLFDVNFGMFTHSQRFYWFNQDSLESTNTFRLIGILLGLAIYNSVILDVHFPMVVYKKLLEKSTNLEDLKDFDPELARGLQQLLDFEGDVESTYARVFQVETESFGVVKKIDLKPNGGNIVLNNQNRQEYVDLYVNWILNESISKQFKAFKNGFDIVCKGPPLELFKYEELELMIVGSSKLDFDALERATIYAEGYKKDDKYIKEFWKVVKSLDDEEKKKFLFFVTGSDRAPIRGLGSMEFIIMKHGTTDQLPTSHTCFNHLLLPKYDNEKQMREKLLLAINNSQGFGLM